MNENESVLDKGADVKQNEVIETFDIDEVKPPKGSRRKVAIISVLILIVLLGGFLGYKIYKNIAGDPTKIIKIVVDDMYEKFSSELEKIDENRVDINLTSEPIRLYGALEIDDKAFPELKEEKLSYDLGLDYSKKYAVGSVGLLKGNSTLGDISLYNYKDQMFIKSKTVFDNMYNVGDSKFEEQFDLSVFDQNTYEIPSLEDIDSIIKGIKDAFLESLDSKMMTLSKENLSLDGETVKTNKITYQITKEAIDNFCVKISESLLKHDDLIEKIADVLNVDKEKIVSYFEKLGDVDSSSDLDGEVSIYTTGVDHKLVRVELLGGEDSIVVTSYDGKTVYSSQMDGTKVVTTAVINDDVCDIDVVVNDERMATFKVRKFDSEGIDFDYKVMYQDMNKFGNLPTNGAKTEIGGTIKCIATKKTDSEISGILELSFQGEANNKKQDIGLKLAYTLQENAKLEIIDFSKALDSFTEEDSVKMVNKTTEISNSAYFKYFSISDLIEDESFEDSSY